MACFRVDFIFTLNIMNDNFYKAYLIINYIHAYCEIQIEIKNVCIIELIIYVRTIYLFIHKATFISVINQLDAQNFCFTISLFHASKCFEHMCSTSGGQNCITQSLVSSHLKVW